MGVITRTGCNPKLRGGSLVDCVRVLMAVTALRGWSLRSWRNGQARTKRTRHGPLGCRGSNRCGATKSDCFAEHTRRKPFLPERCMQSNRAVRALCEVSVSEVSVLCLFLPE